MTTTGRKLKEAFNQSFNNRHIHQRLVGRSVGGRPSTTTSSRSRAVESKHDPNFALTWGLGTPCRVSDANMVVEFAVFEPTTGAARRM